MKKTIFLILIVSAISLQFLSCKKDNDPQPNYAITGLWRGTYTVDGQPGLGSQELNLIIKPDGKMVNDSKATGQQHISLGTWTLTGDTAFVSNATCVYGYPVSIGATQRHTAKFNKATGTLTMGIYINTGNPATGSGTFTVTKVN